MGLIFLSTWIPFFLIKSASSHDYYHGKYSDMLTVCFIIKPSFKKFYMPIFPMCKTVSTKAKMKYIPRSRV